MIDGANLTTILCMALATYATRLSGYLLLRNRQLSPRMQAVMQNVPGCVLISVIAPAFVSDKPADLAALAITLLAASRLSILPTVVIAVTAAGILRHVL